MQHHRGRPVDGSPVKAWADGQFGLVTRAQARAAGLSRDAVDWRVASGRWAAMGRGVYLTTPGRSGWDVSATAAFLQVHGSRSAADAAFAGRTAAFAWGLVPSPPRVLEIAVPHDRRVAAPEGVVVCRRSAFEEHVDGIAYPWRTTVPVTLVDCAADGDLDAAFAVVARAVQRRRTSVEAVAGELRRRRQHPHRAVLLEALGDVAVGAHSAAEVRYVRDVERAHGLPVARRQMPGRVGPQRLHDNVYVEFDTVVEVDGRLGHEGWSDRVRDGRRDRAAGREGRFTTRVFWPDVAGEPCRTALDVAHVLQARGWRGRPRPCRRRQCALRAAESGRWGS